MNFRLIRCESISFFFQIESNETPRNANTHTHGKMLSNSYQKVFLFVVISRPFSFLLLSLSLGMSWTRSVETLVARQWRRMATVRKRCRNRNDAAHDKKARQKKKKIKSAPMCNSATTTRRPRFQKRKRRKERREVSSCHFWPSGWGSATFKNRFLRT